MSYFPSILAAALPAYLIRFKIGPVPTTALEVLIYVLFLATLIWRRRDVVRVLKTDPLRWPILLFMIAGLISALIDPDRLSGLGAFKALFFDAILAYLTVRSNVISSPKRSEGRETPGGLIAAGLILAGLIVTIVSLVQGNFTSDGRLIGIFGYSPNYLALFLAPLIVLAFGYLVGSIQIIVRACRELYCRLLHRSDRLRRPFESKNIWGIFLGLMLLLGLFGYTLFLTDSRGGYLAAIAGIYIVLIFVLRYKIKKAGIFAAILVLIVGLASVFYLERPDYTDPGRKASSSNIRRYVWLTSLKIGNPIKHPKNALLGIGLTNYQNYFTEFTKDRVNYPEFIAPQALTAHNLYLHLWLTTGILGLIAFVWLVIRTLKPFSNFHSSIFPLLAAFLAILIYGLIDTPYFKNDLAIMFWLMIAILV